MRLSATLHTVGVTGPSPVSPTKRDLQERHELNREVQQEDSIRQVSHVTWWGMVVNVLLAAVKGAVGVVSSSQALVADAIHSVSDLVTDVAVLVGVRYWTAPADEEHPYGHGKIQALVTLFIAVALAFVAWELARHTVRSLRESGMGHPGPLAFAVAVVSIVFKEWLFRWTRRVARSVKSTALEANAWHHRSDALSSIPAAVAIAVEYFFPALWWFDELGALVVVAFIGKVAWDLARPALQELVDAGIDDKSAEVAEVARKVPGVLEVHQCRARRYGGAFQADLHVQVDSALSIAAGHALGHDVKDAIVGAGIDVADVVVHVEPRDVRAVVSLGSNLEPRAEYLARALAALKAFPCTHLTAVSRVIETEPVGVPPEFAKLRFLNQVAVFETALEPHEFSRRMHAVEDALGRVRTVRNGPRTIDIDLIDFGGMVLNDPELTLPHPRARERDFVTGPMRELGL